MAAVRWLFLCSAGALSACMALGDASHPIPRRFVAAPDPEPDRALVIVLPGIGADAEALDRHGVARAIQAEWPQADTVLTSAAIAYYAPDGGLVRRLHDELVQPALQRGYRRVWLLGASLGGLGALLYEQQRPGEVTGVLAFAPYLGNGGAAEQIREAGGLERWQAPGLTHVRENPYLDYPRMIWTMARDWLFQPRRASRIWIVCGTDDRLRGDAQLLASSLPPSHYLEVPGGHRWATWLASLRPAIRQIRTADVEQTAQSETPRD